MDVCPQLASSTTLKLFCNSLTHHSCMWLTSVISKACEKRRFYAIAAASRGADGAEGRATGTTSAGRDVSSGCVLLFLQ